MENINKQHKYEILTPYGFKDFNGITKTGKKDIVSILTKCGEFRLSSHHILYNPTAIAAKDIKIGDYILTDVYPLEVLDVIIDNGYEDTYEIIEVDSEDHTYYFSKNGTNVITHNCDELDFVAPNIASEFWTSVQPTLSTGGACIISSTPQYEDGIFSGIWNQANHKFDSYGNARDDGLGVNGFKPLFFTWRSHPERDEKWGQDTLAEMNGNMAKFQQEHECVFMNTNETLIDSVFLSAMKAIEPIGYTDGVIRWYSFPQPNKTHIVFLDPSTGTGGDYAAIQVFEADSMTQVAEWQHNKTPVRKQIAILRSILQAVEFMQEESGEQYDEPQLYWSFENNGMGEAVIVVVEDTGLENFPGKLISDKGKLGTKRRKGLFTTHSAKLSACIKTKSLVESGRLTIKSAPLISQLKKFESNGGTYKGSGREHDDLVMALVLCVRVFTMIINWLDDVDHYREVIEEQDVEAPISLIG